MTEVSVKKDKTGKIMARIGLHVLFWLFAYVFFVVFYGRANRDYNITVIFTMMLFPLSIGTTYFVNYFLIPRYLFAKKYRQFVLFSFYTLVYSVWLELAITMFTLIIISNYQLYKMDPTSFDAVFLIVGLYFIIMAATAIMLARRSFRAQKQAGALENMRMETELKLKEAELKLLKAQIHPHFLFNTLNNLYGLTMEKSDEAPSLVLRLSEMLDYILYRCDAKQVSLSEEINNLKNYLEIEKIRYSEKLRLEFICPERTGKYMIAPLILLPFIENAFKHGVSTNPDTGYVSVILELVEGHFKFTVSNSKPVTGQNKSSKGIGLANVQKRLALLYPGKFELHLEEGKENYFVNLRIELEKRNG